MYQQEVTEKYTEKNLDMTKLLLLQRRANIIHLSFSPWANPDFGTNSRDKDDCCELIAHKVEIENLYDNLSVGVAFKIFFSCKSAGNDL